ncbi:hypothetical protein KDW_41460 [Dictyobacter vulcani]|uniref:Intein C-terminal splicing domain-containing protein n=1 Tax=Dictyobacter vulcani TaxID=2607529 RepID=A0A5J4KKQ9_9CHLR|nr:RHS repeat-associated core domain-containing protein [Dictyobacter vulcani]GER89984.1 hypothetical protein KDW_41460 [Dictyobacter vulcani]
MPTSYNFTGQRKDDQTGLIYFGSRYYDSVSGNFTHVDTVETNSNGSNTYAYAGCNPATATDASGHSPDFNNKINPHDPYVQYIGAWYIAIHPFSDVQVDNVQIPGASYDGLQNMKARYSDYYSRAVTSGVGAYGVPDIVASQLYAPEGKRSVMVHTMWDAKSSPFDPDRRGEDYPRPETVEKGIDQLQFYADRANNIKFSLNDDHAARWRIGTKSNDLSMGAAMLACGDECTIGYDDGSVFKVTIPADGIIAYKIINRPKTPAEHPVVTYMNDAYGMDAFWMWLSYVGVANALSGGSDGASSFPGIEPAPAPAPVFADTGTGDLVASPFSCSFQSNTKIRTATGWQSISQLRIGNQIISYNPWSHDPEEQSILDISQHVDNDLVDVTVSFLSGPKVGSRKTEVIHTTTEHPFLTQEKGFIAAHKLVSGLHLMQTDGQMSVILSVKPVAGTQVMYNLEVANDHTFAVGTGSWIVHNRCAW